MRRENNGKKCLSWLTVVQLAVFGALLLTALIFKWNRRPFLSEYPELVPDTGGGFHFGGFHPAGFFGGGRYCRGGFYGECPVICFTIGSCVVKIRFLFFAVLAFLLFSALGEGAILGLLAALLHEMGHLAAMVGVGMPPREIRLNPFGVDLVKQETTGRSYGKEVLVSLAGPLANGLACFFCLLGRRLGWWEGDGWLMANAALGLMNLLPIEALDGGQALFSLLLLRSPAGRGLLREGGDGGFVFDAAALGDGRVFGCCSIPGIIFLYCF